MLDRDAAAKILLDWASTLIASRLRKGHAVYIPPAALDPLLTALGFDENGSAIEQHSSNVAGSAMTISIATFTQRCERLIEDESDKPLPDNALIGVLCESVRLAREFVMHARSPILEPDPRLAKLDATFDALDAMIGRHCYMAAIDWVKDTDTCHFCGYDSINPKHGNGCPLEPLNALGIGKD